MGVLEAIKTSVAILSSRDRLILGLVTLAQMATAFLDLIGVLLLGLVGVLAASIVSATPLPSVIQSGANLFGWTDLPVERLAALALLSAGVSLVTKTLVSALLTRKTYQFLASRQADLSAQLTRALFSKSLIEVQSHASQDLAFVVTRATLSATVVILGSASTAVADISLLIVMGIGLLAIDPTVTLFAVAYFAVLALVLQWLLSRWATRLGFDFSKVEVRSYEMVQAAVSNFREISVLGRREMYINSIQALRWRAASINADTQFLLTIPKYVFEIALVIGALLLGVSQLSGSNVALTVGIVTVFLVAGARLMPAIMRLQVAGLSIRNATAPAQMVFDLLQELRRASTNEETGSQFLTASGNFSFRAYAAFKPSLRVDDVSFRYPTAKSDAIASVSFIADEGSSVALVGSTGAGKSTLADLILGVLEPDRGRVLIGNLTPQQAVNRWPGAISYVPQNVSLINGSVRENVALGLPEEAVDGDRVWEALRRAHIADFFSKQRDGLDTLVGENGARLSGGQRQRLGVARALYTRPRLLVLDEATSALDAETEQALSRTLLDLGGTVTTITIAHRLATIRQSDLVIYLDHGKLVAKGTFDEVRRTSPGFDRQARLLGL